ncbi:hypothetical protein, partial [Enterobacter hormaechei]
MAYTHPNLELSSTNSAVAQANLSHTTNLLDACMLHYTYGGLRCKKKCHEPISIKFIFSVNQQHNYYL